MKNNFCLKRSFVSFLALAALMGTPNVALGMDEYSINKEQPYQGQKVSKVADQVREAIIFHDNHNYKDAQELLTKALDMIIIAENAQGAAGVGIDVSGKVETGCFITNRDGRTETEYHYNDALPLRKRVASVAYLAADSAAKAKDFRKAAQLYHTAGSYHDKDAPAQIWYKLSGENYVISQQYDHALVEFDLAAEVAIKFYPQKDYICLLPQLSERCSELGVSLSGKDIGSAFSERAQGWAMHLKQQ